MFKPLRLNIACDSEERVKETEYLTIWKDSLKTASTCLLCHWLIFSTVKIRQKMRKSLTHLDWLHGDSLHLSALSLVDFLQ
jgi:hypothetical protein